LKKVRHRQATIIKNLIVFNDGVEKKLYANDRDFSEVYPFIPYQFNLLASVLTSIRTHGASGKHLSEGERSMLALFKESAMALKDESVGAIVPFHRFYDALENFLDHSHKGVIIKAYDNSYINPDHKDKDVFAINVLKTLFMIKYVLEIESNIDNITSLMIENIDDDRIEIKGRVEEALKVLMRQMLVQKNGSHYVFLTDEEQEINREIDSQNVEMAEAKMQAVRSVEAKIGNALSRDAREFNRSQPRNSFIKMSMKYKGPTHFVNVPSEALAEMEQKIQCDNCGARYAVIGSAFFCPCCGKNSARLTFTNTIEKVRAKVRNIDAIRELISQTSKDEAARTCTSLLESCVPDLVVAFQRVCECVYPQLPGAGSLRRNVFQRLDDGSALWRNLVGQGYEDWIDSSEMRSLRICFQQRHLFQHQDGIVDQDYIDKSGDTTYQIGQHIIVKKEDVLLYTDIVEKIGNHVLGLLGGTTHE